jgi:hypothetical protein
MAQADGVHSTPSLYLPTDMTPEEIFRAIDKLRKDARDEIFRLIEFLDKTDDYVSRELEQQDGNDEPEGHDEPSLGSFDRMTNQEKSWRTVDRNPDLYGWSHGIDNEQDHCDHEDDDPAELSEASGIGDQDGLDEQVPFSDWQNVGMV